MAKTQLVYTIQGEKQRTEVFRCMGDARDYLSKVEKLHKVMAAEVKEIEIRESALSRCGKGI